MPDQSSGLKYVLGVTGAVIGFILSLVIFPMHPDYYTWKAVASASALAGYLIGLGAAALIGRWRRHS